MILPILSKNPWLDLIVLIKAVFAESSFMKAEFPVSVSMKAELVAIDSTKA